MHTVTIDSEGRITLPPEWRDSLGLEPGDCLTADLDDGTIRLVRIEEEEEEGELAEFARAQWRAGKGMDLREFASREGILLDSE